ncbi:serine/threonine protein kinase [Streptomyces sp. PvR006]|uniref:serine/threonine-protein kinase n=1 Tax=Streptomyces sp. PvR006 TaxID=2817860 RepID=UPI0027DAD5C0|nr:protein kinase [Streptomyces sp. PvR006]MBP2584422.1 serine/threonine protein kinase [Streptomyces sp. PvR006]
MGTLIGRYVIEHKLGEGGMGTVYLARSRGGRAVAVKVARPELASDPSFRARFRAEVAAARQVGGFHTAQVVDADPDAEAPWLATAYIPGPTLSALVTATEGPMGEGRLRALGAALAEALEAIHACGLVHRDLKPGNIVMAPDGPRVLDFGIARALESTRLTATGSAFGTPGYLAPEQALGEEVTGAADVFALGAVLVAAAGGRPFGDGTPMGLMYRAVHEAPDLASVPESLRGLVGRCLAKDPAGRPTPEEILDVLGEAVTRDGAGAVPPPTVPDAPATPRPPSLPGFGPRQDSIPPQGPVPSPASIPPRGPVPPQGPVPLPYGPPRAEVSSTPVPPQAAVPSAPASPQAAVPSPYAPPPPPPRDAVPPGFGPPTPAFFVPPPPVAPPQPAPDFVAADSVYGIVVDGAGICLQLLDDEAEFTWAEIGAVRYERTRRGRSLRIAVDLYGGTSYLCEIDGRRASRVEEWVTGLDRSLARFLPA